ncbi:hypothetical protein B0H14DRAFT_3731401 [Mycena olivaceomarginata]|nr:hypothetical protein B0H14DRAFT_3731401 [Mycena olivaceomarginata]
MHKLQPTKLVDSQIQCIMSIMHYDLIHYEPVNCSVNIEDPGALASSHPYFKPKKVRGQIRIAIVVSPAEIVAWRETTHLILTSPRTRFPNVLQVHLPFLERYLRRVEENKHFERFTVLQDALDDRIRHQGRRRQVREVGYLCESGPGSPVGNLPVADVEMSNPREKRVAAVEWIGPWKNRVQPLENAGQALQRWGVQQGLPSPYPLLHISDIDDVCTSGEEIRNNIVHEDVHETYVVGVVS